MHSQSYHAPEPYPELRVERENARYAKEMLGNLGGAHSEMGAVSLYFYNHLILGEDPQLSLLFHKISIVEMRHLEIFGTLARLLGADPRLWRRQGQRMQYWSAGYNRYFLDPDKILRHALEEEQKTIDKYSRQIRSITDRHIVENLQRVILDEQLHVQLLQSFL